MLGRDEKRLTSRMPEITLPTMLDWTTRISPRRSAVIPTCETEGKSVSFAPTGRSSFTARNVAQQFKSEGGGGEIKQDSYDQLD